VPSAYALRGGLIRRENWGTSRSSDLGLNLGLGLLEAEPAPPRPLSGKVRSLLLCLRSSRGQSSCNCSDGDNAGERGKGLGRGDNAGEMGNGLGRGDGKGDEKL